jgi:hypothetical protein
LRLRRIVESLAFSTIRHIRILTVRRCSPPEGIAQPGPQKPMPARELAEHRGDPRQMFMSVYGLWQSAKPMRLLTGATGIIDLVIDWKTDVDPSPLQIGLYREQLHDYLAATGAAEGLLVFVTTGQLVWVRTKFRQMPASGEADLHLSAKSSIPTASPRRRTRSGQYEFSF